MFGRKGTKLLLHNYKTAFSTIENLWSENRSIFIENELSEKSNESSFGKEVVLSEKYHTDISERKYDFLYVMWKFF